MGAGDTHGTAGDAPVTSCGVDFVDLSAHGAEIRMCNGWKVEKVDIFGSKSPRICSANPPGGYGGVRSSWMDHGARPRQLN